MEGDKSNSNKLTISFFNLFDKHYIANNCHLQEVLINTGMEEIKLKEINGTYVWEEEVPLNIFTSSQMLNIYLELFKETKQHDHR
jgi:hypothetical protein